MAKRRKRKKPSKFQDIEHLKGGAENAAKSLGVSPSTWGRWKAENKPSKAKAKAFARMAKDGELVRDFDWYVYFVMIQPGKYRTVPQVADMDDVITYIGALESEGITPEDIAVKFRITNKPSGPDLRARNLTMDDWNRFLDTLETLDLEGEEADRATSFEGITAANKWAALKEEGFPLDLGDEVQLDLL